ncbi:barstar family protein [Nonomuraea sp. 3-1Str]|uniref:barstar family protein n=1 Tax=Nonomuraea sp. 3-1Str TaxID=2929801 RepID=UPI0037C7B110
MIGRPQWHANGRAIKLWTAAVAGGPLDFGPYYGNNLAVLRDRLSTDVKRPVKLAWTHWQKRKGNLGADLFDKVRRLLDELRHKTWHGPVRSLHLRITHRPHLPN